MLKMLQGVYFLFLLCLCMFPPAPHPSASSVAGGKGGARARKKETGPQTKQRRTKVSGGEYTRKGEVNKNHNPDSSHKICVSL